jgi:hypothetical protein
MTVAFFRLRAAQRSGLGLFTHCDFIAHRFLGLMIRLRTGLLDVFAVNGKRTEVLEPYAIASTVLGHNSDN